MITNDPPPPVAAAFDAFPTALRGRLLQVRDLIFATAAQTEAVGPLTETLKWGQPAYLTEKTGAGSTVRLGNMRKEPDTGFVFFICHTRLVEDFRASFPDCDLFVDNRAIRLPARKPLPKNMLKICLRQALTYRLRR